MYIQDNLNYHNIIVGVLNCDRPMQLVSMCLYLNRLNLELIRLTDIKSQQRPRNKILFQVQSSIFVCVNL